MPELPEVEVLVRHLRPLLKGKRIQEVQVHRPKVVAPASVRVFSRTLQGAEFRGLSRRGKYLVFALNASGRTRKPLSLVGHLGMTGRMYLAPASAPLPRHAPVVLCLGGENFIFEDTRYFGRLTLDGSALERLGPEPLAAGFSAEVLGQGLRRSTQAIKIKLLDQSLVAGVGNIYASEALFRAGISPTLPSRRLTTRQVEGLWREIRQVLAEAIECGSTVPLNFAGLHGRDRLFYYGRAPEAEDYYEERLRVYGRAGQACVECGTLIKRMVQAARSTYYCPRCQRRS